MAVTGTFENPVSPTPAQVPQLTTGVTAIAVGKRHSCAVVGGVAKCWGNNQSGQAGTGESSAYYDVPTQVKGLDKVSMIAAGVDFSCAVASSGFDQVYCWGENSMYQVGGESTLPHLEPVSLSLLGDRVTGLAAGDGHTCAIVDGAARCWGFNWYGQLGAGAVNKGISALPLQVENASAGVTTISASHYHTCAIINDSARCWGANEYGELGTADAPLPNYTPTAPYGLAGAATSVAAGTSHSCFTVNREVYCTGSNSVGQLGSGNTTSTTVPVKVMF